MPIEMGVLAPLFDEREVEAELAVSALRKTWLRAEVSDGRVIAGADRVAYNEESS